MILGLIPGNLGIEPDRHNIANWVRGSTPWRLKRSTPSLCQQRRLQHVVHSVFEDASIDGSIFVDELEVSAIDGIVPICEDISIVRRGNLPG